MENDQEPIYFHEWITKAENDRKLMQPEDMYYIAKKSPYAVIQIDYVYFLLTSYGLGIVPQESDDPYFLQGFGRYKDAYLPCSLFAPFIEFFSYTGHLRFSAGSSSNFHADNETTLQQQPENLPQTKTNQEPVKTRYLIHHVGSDSSCKMELVEDSNGFLCNEQGSRWMLWESLRSMPPVRI